MRVECLLVDVVFDVDFRRHHFFLCLLHQVHDVRYLVYKFLALELDLLQRRLHFSHF